MKIAVCVKHVPDGHMRIDPGTNRLDRTGAGMLNDFDTYAIEEALRLKEAGNGEVIVVSVGPEEAIESLRTALALGADRVVLISDPGAVGSDLVATSKILAKALGRENPDLVLFGQQTSDATGGVLWAAVGEQLQGSIISQVTELAIDGTSVRAKRQTEYGDDVIEAPLPAFVAVSDAINEPRYASLKGMMGAKKKPLEILSLADIGLHLGEAGDAGSKTVVIEIGAPPARSNSTKIEDDGNAAQAIVDFLVEKQLA